ncbi:meiosis 1 arrest protein [Stigmatopora argus]
MDESSVFGSPNARFLRQPARLLIVEAVPPWWSETSTVICDALDNFLTLAASLNGPRRLPLFSLYSITSQAERLLPFQSVGSGNLSSLRACVDNLRSIPGQGVTPEPAGVGDSIRDVVLAGLGRLADDVRFGRTDVSSVQVTVLTGRPGRGIVRLLGDVLNGETPTPSASFVVVQLYTWARWSEYELPAEDPETAESRVPVDLKQVESNVFAVEAVFKQWLQDYGRDVEHVQLLLRESPSPVAIKCDVQECLIGPGLLPLRNPESTENPWNRESVSQAPQMLRAVKTVLASGTCRSLSHGSSLTVHPTTNGRQDWEEFEVNQSRFQALNRALEHSEQVLLLRLEITPGQGGPPLSSFYVLQPSPSLAMLLSPLTCGELFLPVTLPVPDRDPPGEVVELIDGCLSELDRDHVLNPSSLSGNVYRYLRSSVQRPQNPTESRASAEIYQKLPLGGQKLASKLSRKSTSLSKAQPVPLRPVQSGSGSSDPTFGHSGPPSQAQPTRGGAAGRRRRLGPKYGRGCWMGGEVQ